MAERGLEPSFEAYLERLRSAGAIVPELLRPPASESRLDEWEQANGLRLVPELRALYSRCDGTDSDPALWTGNRNLLPIGYFPPLGAWSSFDVIHASEAEFPSTVFVRHTPFMLFLGGKSLYLAVSLSSQSDGAIWLFDNYAVGEESLVRVASSLGELFEVYNRLFDQGWIAVIDREVTTPVETEDLAAPADVDSRLVGLDGWK